MKSQLTLTEKISLKLFLICMFLCAALFIVVLWTEPDEIYVRMIMTLFVIGLASFLTWLPIILYRISKR